MHRTRDNLKLGIFEEKGNITFLLFIAVALLAALSYAVFSSGRVSEKSSAVEEVHVNSTQIVEFPIQVYSNIIRMIVAGADQENIRFNRPGEFETLDKPEIGVFHPLGGGAAYSQVPADFMADGLTAGDWVFNAELEVPSIAIEGKGGNDVIAYLSGIKGSICKTINQEYGIGDRIPVIGADLSAFYKKRMYDDGEVDYEFPEGKDVPDIDDDAGSFDSQPFGCFENADGTYVYYHVLLER